MPAVRGKEPAAEAPGRYSSTELPGGRYSGGRGSGSGAIRLGMLTLAVAPDALMDETVWLPSPHLQQRLQATLVCRALMEELLDEAWAAAHKAPAGSAQPARAAGQGTRGAAGIGKEAAGCGGEEQGAGMQSGGGEGAVPPSPPDAKQAQPGCCSMM